MKRYPVVNDARLRHLSAHLHALGPRAVYEVIREVVDGADLLSRLEVYSRLDPEILSALGGRDLPPASFYMVEAPAA